MSLQRLVYPAPLVTAEGLDEMPIGFYFPWNNEINSELPEWFARCDGQLLNDPQSPLHQTYIPNLNGIAKTKTVTLSDSSDEVTMTTTRDIYAGATITGTGLVAGTVVLEILNDTTIRVSNIPSTTGATTATIGGNGGIFLRGGITSGVWEPDRMQKITGSIRTTHSGGGDIGIWRTPLGALDSSEPTGNNLTVTGGTTRGSVLEINSSNSPNARTGENTWDDTHPMNQSVVYVMKTKLLGRTKLIMGYNIEGQGFTSLPIGVAEAEDYVLYYDASAGLYKRMEVNDIKGSGGGVGELGNYEIVYNATTDSLNFNYIG